MNDSTIIPNDGTIRPGANNGGNNDSTVRPSADMNDNGSTVRPGMNDNGSTVRPGMNDNGSTVRPGMNDNGSTVRPGMNDNGSTVRPNTGAGGDSNATVRQAAGNGDMGSGSTIRANNDNGGTIVANSNMGGRPQQATQAQAANSANTDYKNQKGAIFGLPDIFIDGKKLHVVEYLKQVSGEAQLIKVESKGKQYMLKLYLSGIHPNHDMLEKVKTIPQGMPGLMRLYKHGTWTSPSDDKDVRDYEIMELCEGGTLSDLDLKGDEERWKKLAMQMAISIDLCHKRGFLHLDVKPDNFLFVDKQRTNLVLGDFGLAVAIDANGKGQCSQARTKKYAAPEIYSHIEGQLIDVDDKSDFYSLGISLMRIWMGQEAFDKIFEGKNERQLIKMKQYEQIPMPTGLSAHSLSLIKALLLFNNSERAGFADIQRWIKGENLVEDEAAANQNVPQMSIVYNGAKNQVAHSMNELAHFMLEDQELAKKYLYSGKLSKLIDQTNPEMALNIDQITEEWYPSNKSAGLAAAIFTLDEEYPWTDVKGKQMSTFAEIAESLLYNFDQYCEDLKDKDHTFYVYLRVNGEQAWADNIYQQLEKNAQDNLLRFIYEYNAKLPFRIVTTSNQIHYVDNINDVLQYGENLSDDSKWEITCGGFTKWVNSRNGMIAAEVEKYLQQKNWATECYPGVLYLLNKQCGYDYKIVADAKDPNALFTPAQLAARLNKLVSDYGQNSDKYSFFHEFMNIDGSRLEQYLTVRGFRNQINYIKYCFDLKSQTNTGKPGPYNKIIAAYKCIAGMGATPYYICGSKKLTSLADVNKLTNTEKKNEYTGRQLGNWLTIFFQENPKLNLNQAYTYELETEKYLKYIEGFNSSDHYVSRFRQAVEKTEACVDKIFSLRKRVLTLRWVVILLGLVPLVGLALYSLIMGLPFDGNPLETFNSTVFAILFIICTIGFFALSEGEGGCIGELIWGGLIALAIYWGLYFILKLLMPFAGYIVAGLLLLYAWKIYSACIGSVSISNTTDLLGNDELVVAPLHFAYRSNESISQFTPTVELRTENEEAYLENVIQKIKKKTLWSVVTSILISSLLIFMGAAKGLSFSSSDTEIATVLNGSWNGEFQGKAATLVIDNVNEKTGEVNGTMFVKFKNLAQESVSGTAKDGDKITLELKDNVQNGVLDGTYNIYVDKSAGTMECQYRNSKTGKEVGFTLTKDGSAENVANEADEADVVETTSKKSSSKKNENSQKSETNSSSSDASSNTQATETSKPAGHSINIQGSSSSHSINTNGGSRQHSTPKHENSNSGGYNIKVNSSNNSGGGFKLEEIN